MLALECHRSSAEVLRWMLSHNHKIKLIGFGRRNDLFEVARAVAAEERVHMDDALELCESIAELERSDPDIGDCTVSIGIAESPRHGTTVSGLLEAADAALYKAKRGGRDAVEVADG